MTTSVRAAVRAPGTSPGHHSRRLVGTAAIFFPLVYLLSDLIEVAQGEFTILGLTMTYVGEAGFPLFVIALCALFRTQIPWWGLMGGIAYAYSFIFFTSTVVWAIVAGTPNWEVLSTDFGWWMTVHGAVMVAGGMALGVGLARSPAIPTWIGCSLALGVVLVAATASAGNLERTLATAVPNIAFMAWGIAMMRRRPVAEQG